MKKGDLGRLAMKKSACVKSGKYQLALSVLSSMPGMRVMPDEVSHNAAISACKKCARWQKALFLLQ